MTQKKVKLRHNRILNELKRKGNVDLHVLADKLGFHEMTIRRDLKKLEEDGYLIRTLGGACLVPKKFLGYSTKVDRELNYEKKEKIVEYVSKNLVEEEESIFLSSGVTMLQLLKQLHKDYNKLQILTNSVDNISYEFGSCKFELEVAGGHLRPDAPCTYGELTKKNLEQMRGRVDKVFVEVDAVVSEDGFKGFMQYNNFEASVYKLVLSLTDTENIYVLADSAKFEKLAIFQVGDFSMVNKVITNELPDEIVEKFGDLSQFIQVPD